MLEQTIFWTLVIGLTQSFNIYLLIIMKLFNCLLLFSCFFVLLGCNGKKTAALQDFVVVKNTGFEINGKPYHYLGTNFWYGLNLGSKGAGGNRDRLIRELDRLKTLGVTN